MALPYTTEYCKNQVMQKKYEELADVKSFRLWAKYNDWVIFPDSFIKTLEYLPPNLQREADKYKTTAWAAFSYTPIVAYIKLLQLQYPEHTEELNNTIADIQQGLLWKNDNEEFHVNVDSNTAVMMAAEIVKDTIYKDVVPKALAKVFKTK